MTKNVYQLIAEVASDISAHGIAKNRRNSQGSGFNFRGIDDVQNALSPLLARHKLVILPRVIGRTCEERLSKSGGNLFYTTVEVEYDFVSAEDGSKHTIKMYGEAMDSGDKSTNKAMSAAYKYAAIQAFCIPVEGDPDHESHQVEAKKPNLSNARFAKAVEAIKSGQYSTENLRKDFALTEEQESVLVEALANA